MTPWWRPKKRRSKAKEISEAIRAIADAVHDRNVTEQELIGRLRARFEELQKVESNSKFGLPNELAYRNGWHDAFGMILSELTEGKKT